MKLDTIDNFFYLRNKINYFIRSKERKGKEIDKPKNKKGKEIWCLILEAGRWKLRVVWLRF